MRELRAGCIWLDCRMGLFLNEAQYHRVITRVRLQCSQEFKLNASGRLMLFWKHLTWPWLGASCLARRRRLSSSRWVQQYMEWRIFSVNVKSLVDVCYCWWRQHECYTWSASGGCNETAGSGQGLITYDCLPE